MATKRELYAGEKSDCFSETESENGLECENQMVVSRGRMVTPEKPKKSRWRKRNIEGRAKVLLDLDFSRTGRNLGFSYIDAKGRQREAKVLGPPCQCKKNCRQLFQGTASKIFNSFWDLESRGVTEKTKHVESARHVTNQYFVKVNGVDIQICKTEFLSLHGLQKSSKRVKLIAQQISEGRTTPKRDGRGKHHNRPNKTPTERVQSVHDHIQAIPKYVSHYSRKVNPNRVFLNHDLNISTLYKDYYVEWCKQRGIVPVKEDGYSEIFCSDYNIGFKLPKSDTCHTCDLLNNQIETFLNSSQAMEKQQRANPRYEN
nr:unnamed protein product [Callosobruchus chinensis]